MELEQIFKLIDAGYTKADIEAMTSKTGTVEAPTATVTTEGPTGTDIRSATKTDTVENPTGTDTETKVEPAKDEPSVVDSLKAEIEQLKSQLAGKNAEAKGVSTEIMDEVKKLRESIQAQNIQNSTQPKVDLVGDFFDNYIK